MAWFRHARQPKEADPVVTINLLGRLDSAIDRLDGLSDQLLKQLDELERKERPGGGN